MIQAGEVIESSDFINESEADPTPANDEGKVVKLEDDGKISELFTRVASKFTADEDLLANIPVGINIDGKIVRACRSAVALSGAPAGLVGASQIKIISVDTNKYILSYVPTSGGGDDLKAVAFTVNDDLTLTFGSEASLVSNMSGRYGICKIDTNSFIFVSGTGSSGFYKTLSVSTLSISEVTSGELTLDNVSSAECCQLDTNKIGFCYTVSDGSVRYTGTATISAGTATVEYSTTSVISNITTNENIYMAKINANKFCIVNGTSGYAVILTSSGSLVVGTSVSLSLTGTKRVLSIADDTFYVLYTDAIRYHTISGTVITGGDTETMLNDQGGDLFVENSNVFVYKSDSAQGESGILKITLDGSTIVKTPIMPLEMSSGIAGYYSGAYVVLSDSYYHIREMTSNFIGFTAVDADIDEETYVNFEGSISGQTGIIAGSLYEILNGELVETLDTSKKYTVVGKTSTSIVIQ